MARHMASGGDKWLDKWLMEETTNQLEVEEETNGQTHDQWRRQMAR